MLTELVKPEEYGRLSLALSIGPFICQTTFAIAMPGIARYFAISIEKNKQYEFFKSAMGLMFYGTLLSFAVVLTGLLFLNYFSIINMKTLVLISVIYLIISNYNTIFTEFQNIARQRIVAVFHSCLDSWLKILLAYLITHYFFSDAESIIYAYILSLLIVLISQSFFIKKIIQKSECTESGLFYWKNGILAYSKPFILINLFSGFQSIADRWSLKYFTSTTNVGYFAPLTQLGYTPLLMISGVATTLIGPILFMKSGDGTNLERNSSVRKITVILALVATGITLFCSVFTYFFHEIIFKIFVAKEYQSVSYLLPLMVLSGGLFSTGQIFSLKLMSDLNTKLLLLPKIVTTFLAVTLSIMGAYYGGIKGIVISSVIFSLTHYLWLGTLSLRKANNHTLSYFKTFILNLSIYLYFSLFKTL